MPLSRRAGACAAEEEGPHRPHAVHLNSNPSLNHSPSSGSVELASMRTAGGAKGNDGCDGCVTRADADTAARATRRSHAIERRRFLVSSLLTDTSNRFGISGRIN
jgi:hypothetical protein